jgi:NitT/TauT family transport system ATP-binding protein
LSPLDKVSGVTGAPQNQGIPITLTNVARRFDIGTAEILSNISLQVPAGEFLAVLGASGSGKTTLLRMIAGLDLPTSGEVAVGGQPTWRMLTEGEPRRASIAYVFQDAHLLPWRNVVTNVELPLELVGVPAHDRRMSAMDAIGQVGLWDAALKYPNQLSGGMRMRVSLARALVTGPQLLLLDEPFAALDEITRQRLDEQLRGLWLARGMTTIFITHSTTEAAFLAERAVVLSSRPARVIADLRIDLPPIRAGALRATPEFALQTRKLYEALEVGSDTAGMVA